MINSKSLRQFGYILSGFIVGQGLFFLSQTYLLLNGHISEIANIGIAIGFLSLAQWISDAGGVYLISKLKTIAELQDKFITFSVSRLVVTMPLLLIICFLLKLFDLGEATRVVIPFILLTGFVGAFSCLGVVDYLQRNGFSSSFSGLCWLFPAVYIFMAGVEYQAAYIGMLYVSGLLIFQIIQYTTLVGTFSVRFKVEFRLLPHFMKQIFFYLTAYIISQGYARLIPVMVDKMIDSISAGLYMYAKGVINILGQMMIFTRRIEFSKLSDSLVTLPSLIFLIGRQKLSYGILVLFVLLVVFTSFLIEQFWPHKYTELITYILLLSVIFSLWLASSSFGQVFIARGWLVENAAILFLSAFSSIMTIFFTYKNFGIYTFFISEALMMLVQLCIYKLFIDFFWTRKRIS